MSSELHVRHPSLGGLASGEGALRALGLEGQWGLSAGAPQSWEKRDSTLGDCTQGFMCTGTQGKAMTPQELG